MFDQIIKRKPNFKLKKGAQLMYNYMCGAEKQYQPWSSDKQPCVQI